LAVGALIGAYQEVDSGGLRALFPLAGRTLLEYQVRCASAAGAAPIVVVVERVPQSLQDALERLRLDGVGVIAVSDVQDAVSRFEAGAPILLIGDGIAPTADLVAALCEHGEPAVVTVPDDEAHQGFERIDGQARWAGVAIIDQHLLGSTAAMLGDWDLQSTVLRRTIQEGATRLPVGVDTAEPLLVERPEQLEDFQRALITGSRARRLDWVSRYLLPPVEDFATERLMETSIRPVWLVWGALALTVLAAAAFLRGWHGAAVAMLVLSTPLDLIAARIASIRIRPLASRMWTRRALWPAAGLALLALGLWETRHGSGWGALVSAATALAFAEAARIERPPIVAEAEIWLFSRRNAIFCAIPFAIVGAWATYLVVMLVYAAASFFLIQHARHSASELTRS
jgi:hypothetical protein